MASRKYIKKALNNMVFDIVEECFTIQLFDETKIEKTNVIINEAADFQDAILAQISKAKTKQDFAPINSKIEESALEFINKLNSLN
ncbi:MAG: hypothetical protein HYR91_02210 [Flavobacteriia bacterium]|nr:hypothetical protein [Flavobacteriia bacterium]